MKVTLKHITPKKLVVDGIRICWKSDENSDTMNDNLGENDESLIRKIIKFGHTSTLEHSLITFEVDGISRALLQELSRHRVGISPSVESTRYTLRKIINGENNISDCLVKSGSDLIDQLNKKHMEELAKIIKENNLSNDVAKYGLVEAYKVREQISFNIRSLRHFLMLRTSKKALPEIRELAFEMFKQIPEDYHIFFEDITDA